MIEENQFGYTSNDENYYLKEIEQIKFMPYKSDEIIKYSHLPLTKPTMYNREDKTTTELGVLDKRLGPSNTEICTTCNLDFLHCSGHFGYIKLFLPVFHVGYFKKTQSILQSICKECSRILLNEDLIQRNSSVTNKKGILSGMQLKLKNVTTECKKTKQCPHCGYLVGKMKKKPGDATKIIYVEPKDDDSTYATAENNGYILHANVEEQKKISVELKADIEKVALVEFTPLRAYNLLKKMTKEDAALFLMDTNCNRPEDLIVTHVCAPPNCIRPTVTIVGDKTNEDDATAKLYEMIGYNEKLQKAVKNGVDIKHIMEDWTALQNIYTLYINSESTGIPQELAKTTKKGFCQRLKGKMGRFRGNLSGKRVDYSARTVITPDPNLRINQVAVPMQMALILTYGELVTKRNYTRLVEAIKNGPDKYPGANFVTFKDSTSVISLAFQRNKLVAEKLKIGDKVHRHLRDDDVILFNRQPSLHKLSIMGFQAKVMPGRTLRFNECCCNPFNADFDGDEMNIHLPQTELAKAEVMHQMSSIENIVSPKNGEPIITLIQDFFTSAFQLTNKDIFLCRNEFCQIMSYITDAEQLIQLPPPAIIKPVELWTGKQIISTLITPNEFVKPIINIEVKEKNYLSTEDKKHFDIADGYVCFFNSELICGNIGKATLGSSKNSLIYTLIKDNSRYLAASCMLRFAKLSARWLSEYGISLGLTDVTPSQKLLDLKRDILVKEFKKCDQEIEKYKNGQLVCKPGCDAEETLESDLTIILNNIRDEAGKNCVKILPKTNAALIMAVCGSKGSNLNLSQMISTIGQQTIGGKRIKTGFSKRTLPHFEIDSKTPESRGFSKNGYWDGLEAPEFFFHTMAGREGLIDTAVKTADTGYMQRRLIKALEDVVQTYDNSVRNSENCIIQFTYGDDGLDPINMETSDSPIHLERLMKYCKTFLPKKYNEYTLSYKEIEAISKNWMQSLKSHNNTGTYAAASISDKFLSTIEEFIKKIIEKVKNLHLQFASENFNDIFDSNYTAQIAITEIFVQTERQFNFFFERLLKKLEKSRALPGDGVGAVTAQSIGEPCTQMTLKTFHFAGVSSMNVTLGVPRIKEIINASKKIQTPIISIDLLNKNDETRSKIVKNQINVIYLKDVAHHIKEIYEPGGCYLEIKLNIEVIRSKFLNINTHSVKNCIVGSKLKLKPKNIEVTNNKIKIEPYDTSEREMIFIMADLKKKLANVIVAGVPTIKRAIINCTEDTDAQGFKVKEYNIFADGIGLRDVLAIEGVDYVTTKTNHIMEINEVLGIEAARITIIEQIKLVVGIYGINIDIRHINVLADVMSSKGKINGINRYGLAKMRDSVLMLASFEKTADVLFDAAYFAKVDNIKGVSEKIILGDMMKIGTGHFDLLYNQDSTENYLVDRKFVYGDSVLG